MSEAMQAEATRVKVTNADFNGRDWDGCPFSAMPPWLVLAGTTGLLKPHTRRCTDYADWDVTTPHGVVSAEPGDEIVWDGENMRVFRLVRTELKP